MESSLRPEISAYYALGREQARLASGPGVLERLRTQRLLSRFLPEPPAAVLDVGGGPGGYAGELAVAGYRVHVVDPVPLHVEQAGALPGVTAALGDARGLAEADASQDAVLLLGPLYHLLDAPDRLRALREAARVVRPGGPVLAAAISRFAPLYDGLYHGWITAPDRAERVRAGLPHGRHEGSPAPDNAFTTAFFHHPDQLAAEVSGAGLALAGVFAVEGAAWMLPDRDDWLADPDRRELLLDLLARVETEPSLLGISAHLLAVAHRSG